MISSKKIDGLLDLLNNVPNEIKNKIAEYTNQDEIIKGQLELIVLFGENEEIVREKVEALGSKFENLGYGFGIITTNPNDVDKIALIKEIQYLELPKTLYTSGLIENKEICAKEVWDSYNCTGEGVLIGFIDSGIDYMHPAFMNEQNETRILYICDFSQGGKVWDKKQIDEAIKSNNPYSIVSERDVIGHGTSVAGTASAGGNINKENYGAAYRSFIAMVKMTGVGKVNYAKSTQLMRGIKFLLDKSNELDIPLVINLSFSTNDGAHNGSSLLEKYISTVTALERISFVIAAGNEGDSGHHVGGKLREQNEITFNMGLDEKTFVIQLYKDFLTDIAIEIKNPMGISSGNILINKQINSVNLGQDSLYIYNSGPKPFDINGEILFSFVNENSLTSGLWTITLFNVGESQGRFDMWMPISEGLNPNTKFLKPDPINTLGIPGTVNDVITAGSYDFTLNSISSFSGRGALLSSKPDLVAPGEKVLAPIPEGFYDTLSGTSFATPLVAASAALLMEWGIVKGNDPLMYGDRLKYFLLKGAIRDRKDIDYPSPLWGYGKVCVKGGLELAINSRSYGKLMRQLSKNYNEYFFGEQYGNFIIEYEGDLNKVFDNIDFGAAFALDERYAVAFVEYDKAYEFFKNTIEIVYVEEPTIFTLSQVSPIDAANISEFHNNPVFQLRGNGVMVGIIDTGIDYLNDEFIYEDNTTRIINIWDQSIEENGSPGVFGVGKEYTREEINEAINVKKAGGDPYSIVNSKDIIGHGTAMAGIVGGRGKNPELIGAAPDCEFLIVKLNGVKNSIKKQEGVGDKDIPMYCSAELVLGIKYLYEKSRELRKSLVILLPFESNKGAHDGTAITERYIDEISKVRGLVVATGVGNQGDEEIHTSGDFEKIGDVRTIELKVDSLQKNLKFEIWCSKPDKISIGIVSPSGEVIDKIPARLFEEEIIKLVYEGSVITVNYSLPEEITGDERITIQITNIRGGLWKFNLYADYVVTGRYNAWLPQRALLMEETRFLNPTQNGTITIPSTSEKAISTAFYNQNINTVVVKSGRGYTRNLMIKPEIAGGGVNVKTTKPGGGETIVSGSSVGAAVTAGACALILEWGIVKGNDPTMYSTKVKTYLIRGAGQRKGDIYPNRNWGYGQLDMEGVFREIRT
ncbi:S8 family serine peptidase [Clostridium sp. DL1XJH146]